MDPFDLAADLDAFAAETDLFDDTSPDVEAVELPDDLDECRDLANKLLRKHGRLDRDAHDIKSVASAEYERIAHWAEDRLSGIDRERERVESLLDRLMRSYKQAANAKTLTLPNGTLRLRPAKDRLIVEDDNAFVTWAKSAGRVDELVRTKQEPDAVAVKGCEWGKELSLEPLPGLKRWRLVEPTTGEVVPGVYMETDEEQNFTLTSARDHG